MIIVIIRVNILGLSLFCWPVEHIAQGISTVARSLQDLLKHQPLSSCNMVIYILHAKRKGYILAHFKPGT